MRPNLRSRRRAGFTLIELLAVILIIGILLTFLLPRIPEAIDRGKVTACKKNLSEIFSGLVMYTETHNRMPSESGVRFFASLIYSGTWDNSKSTAIKLTCPGVDIGTLEIGKIDDPREWFKNKDVLTGDYSSYAGRDMKNHPLKRFPGSGNEAIVADDNQGGGDEGNHRKSTVVLYADGSLGTHEIGTLQEKGVIDKSVNVLQVGPDSPLPELRNLTLD